MQDGTVTGLKARIRTYNNSNMDFTGVKYYVVDVVDSVSSQTTEERVYLYEDTDCHLEYVNLLWVNSLVDWILTSGLHLLTPSTLTVSK